MPTIEFRKKSIKTLEVAKGTTILEAAMANDVPLYHTCGGNASCSTCRVRVLEGAGHLSPIEDAEKQVLEAFDLQPPHRLGCQSEVLGGRVVVEIPERDREPRANKTPELP